MSKPKIPTPAPVIERQAYRDPASRESLAGASGEGDKVRRAMMGVITSAQGVKGEASTTKRVKLGGDQVLTPDLGGASTGGSGAFSPGSTAAPTGSKSKSALSAPVRAYVATGGGNNANRGGNASRGRRAARF